MKNKTKGILDAGVFVLVLLFASFVANTSFAYLNVYRPFGGRITSYPTTPGLVCPGQGDISTSGTYGTSALLHIPIGTRNWSAASSGRWILGLHLPALTPTCVLDEVPFEVYNVTLYGTSR
jgi:hypothetical protein